MRSITVTSVWTTFAPSLPQSEDQLGGALSVLVRQRRDHDRLDRLLHRLDAAALEDQPGVLAEISRLVFPHAFAEEAVLWPALRRVSSDGDDLTLDVELEHQEVNEFFARLDRMPLHDPARPVLLSEIVDWLRRDVRDEEEVLLPRLQESLDERQLRRLGVAWEVVRRTAPRRPHPDVSRRPPGQTASALPLTVLDHARDLLDGVARRASSVAPVLTGASTAIGAATGRVERSPAFRTGERRATHRPPGEERG